MFTNAWRQSVDRRLSLIIYLLQKEIPMDIQDAKAALDAEIAKAAAQNAADFQTLDTAVAANATATQKVSDDITTLLNEVKAGNPNDIDVTAELTAIQANADDATKAANTIQTAVNAATTQATTADQAANPPDSSDMEAPKS
jgi:hypothetical protein